MSLRKFKNYYIVIVIILCLLMAVMFLKNFAPFYVWLVVFCLAFILPFRHWFVHKYWRCPYCKHLLPIDFKGEPDFAAARNGCEFCGKSVESD